MKSINMILFIALMMIITVVCYLGFVIVNSAEFVSLVSIITFLPLVIMIDVGLFMLFAHKFWDLRIFKTWLVKVPNLTGTWIGEMNLLQSESSDQPLPPIPMMFAIKQNLFGIKMELHTLECVSKTISTEFKVVEDAMCKLQLAYVCHKSDNENSTVDDSKSQILDCALNIVMGVEWYLQGRFCINDEKCGEMLVKHQTKKVLTKIPNIFISA